MNESAPSTTPQVIEQLRINAEYSEQLEVLVSKLRERLTGILRGGDGISGYDQSKAPPQPALVPFANDLRSNNTKLQSTVSNVNDMLARLEI